MNEQDAPTRGQVGGVLSSRLRMALPTPLAQGLRRAGSRMGTDAERLGWRLSFAEDCARFLVGVLDVERRTLGLPRPIKVADLVRRLDRPTIGAWAQAAQALAAKLAVQRPRLLPPIARGLLDSSPDTNLLFGLKGLIALRNEVAHDDGFCALEPRRASALLQKSTRPFRSLVRGLEPLCDLRLVVQIEEHTRLDGATIARAVVHQGETPWATTIELPRSVLGDFQPALLTADGSVLPLHPWFTIDQAKGDHRVLALDRWQDAQPTYSMADVPRRPWRATALDLHDLEVHGPSEWVEDGIVRHAALAAVPVEVVRLMDPALEPEAPPEVGMLQPLRRLGRGGTGTVWLVEDPERDGMRIALKVLHPALAAQREHIWRMKREHEVLRRLSIPGVVQVHDVIFDNTHGPCLLMEWVDGNSLARVVAERAPLPAAEAGRLVDSILETLAIVHEREILHRDLKPSNVLLHGDRPRLIDFGVARTDDGMTLTATADIVGTLAYAAPEHLDGQRATPASDLYGVGRILEELLLGPRTGPQDRTMLSSEVLRVLRRSLQRDPAQRFQSAAEMRGALAAALEDEGNGCVLGPGDSLPGGGTVQAVQHEVVPGIHLLQTTFGGLEGAILAPAASGAAQARLHQLVREVPAATLRVHGCHGLRTTDDGIPYLELRPDRASERAELLLGLRTSDGEGTSEEATPVAVVEIEERSEGTPQPPPPDSGSMAPEPQPGGVGPTKTEGEDQSLSGAEAALLALGAAAAGAVVAHAAGNLAGARKAGPRTEPETTRSGTTQRRRASSGPRNTAAVVGGMLGLLSKSAKSQLGPAARTRTLATHHAALLLLATEHATGGIELSEDNWRKAWRTTLGGLLVLLRLYDRSGGPVSRALRAEDDLPALQQAALRVGRRRSVAPDTDPDVRTIGAVLLRVLRRVQADPALASAGWRDSYAKQFGDRVGVRRVPAAAGWQAVDFSLLQVDQ